LHRPQETAQLLQRRGNDGETVIGQREEKSMDLLSRAMGYEETEDTRAIKIAMVIAIPFFVSLLKSCDDVRYRMSGKSTTAVVSSITEQRSRFGNVDGYLVWYTFGNANTNKQVNGSTLVGVDRVNEYFVGQKLDIEYRGDDFFTCRIKGSGGWFWQAFFVVSSIAVVVLGIIMTVRASRQERKWRTRHPSAS
jgi:hypothetical protein